jgi:hypothetical protein
MGAVNRFVRFGREESFGIEVPSDLWRRAALGL